MVRTTAGNTGNEGFWPTLPIVAMACGSMLPRDGSCEPVQLPRATGRGLSSRGRPAAGPSAKNGAVRLDLGS